MLHPSVNIKPNWRQPIDLLRQSSHSLNHMPQSQADEQPCRQVERLYSGAQIKAPICAEVSDTRPNHSSEPTKLCREEMSYPHHCPRESNSDGMLDVVQDAGEGPMTEARETAGLS